MRQAQPRAWSRFSVRGDVAPGRVFWLVWTTLLAAFIALAAWVNLRGTLAIDRRATFWVQDLRRFSGVGTAFEVVNRIGDYDVIIAVLIASVVLLAVRRRWLETLILAGIAAAYYAEDAVRVVVARPTVATVVLPRHVYPDAHGFPSGHVFGEVLVYGLVFAYASRAIPSRQLVRVVRLACVIEIALGGPARMYIGAHWLSDVIGAALLASLYLLAAYRLDRLASHA